MKPSDRTAATPNLAHLRADVRYSRERRDLYRAKAYGPHATSPTRMREREREYEQAVERLKQAEAQLEAPAPESHP